MLSKFFRGLSNLKSEFDYRVSLSNHAKKLPILDAQDQLIVDNLKKEGVYITSLEELNLPTTEQMLDSAYSYAASMIKPRDIHASYNLPQVYTVTHLPEFFTWGIEARLQGIIENYIGLPIAFHGVHVRKDFPNAQQLETLLWHKDSEDRRMIKVIIYLHDVTREHGAFEYVPFPKNLSGRWNDYRIDRELTKSNFLGIDDNTVSRIIPQSAWKYCTGKAGTVVLADTRGILHHGTVRTQERSTIFFAYTANPPKRPELCTQYNDDTFFKPEPRILTQH